MEPEEPAVRPQIAKPLDLSRLSIHDLKDYIAGLEAEIMRAKAAIEAKQSHRAAADAFFGRGRG